MTKNEDLTNPPAKILIAGGGIVGLVLALALKKHIGIVPEIYERAEEFHDDVGAALGMYPNALRVLRDIDPALMHAIKDQGAPYVYRRFERHDGSNVATAREDVLHGRDSELCSFGIRRWRLQKELYKAVLAADIPMYFGKCTNGVIEHPDGRIEVQFTDGTSRFTDLLLAADGSNSTVRRIVAEGTVDMAYTGVTCLMGISDCPSPRQGISFPTSTTSNFHAVYFPTGPNEQCFQIHFPIDEANADKSNWGNLSKADGQEEFEMLANKMEKDGWHERYVEPLRRVSHAVKVGFAQLTPNLTRWVYGKTGRIFLVGDAAHPPVPYVGQGAQMGVEDAGTLCLLLKHLCCHAANGKTAFDMKHIAKVGQLYEQLRIPRTNQICECSRSLGRLQTSRSSCEESARVEELLIEGEIMMNDTLTVMFPGATFNYSKDVMSAILHEKSAQVADDRFGELMLQAEQLFDEREAVAGW